MLKLFQPQVIAVIFLRGPDLHLRVKNDWPFILKLFHLRGTFGILPSTKYYFGHFNANNRDF